MLIQNTRLRGREGLWDIVVREGKIESIVTSGSDNADGETFEAHGFLAVPQFCENHIHLDYTNTAGTPRHNESGTLFEGIQIWGERKKANLNNLQDIKANALKAVRSAVGHGVGFIRTHVDVTDADLIGLRAILELKEEVKNWCEIQIVAFPQSGIIAYPNGKKLMRTAMDMGANVVGGIPHLEPTREDGLESLKFVFDLAEEYNALIDVHCDEIDDEQSRFLDMMVAETTKRGMHGRVTASHAVAMGYYKPAYLARLMPKIVASGIYFAIAPRENLHLQGRDLNGPTPRGIAPVRTIVEYEVPVAFCQDSICDPWYPIGDGSPLRNLDTGLHACHMLTNKYINRCLDFITVNPAASLNIGPSYGIEVGKPANLIVLGAQSDRDVLRTQPVVLLSLHNGREVFRQSLPKIEWAQ